MILNDFTQPKLKFSREKLDAVLVELCGMVIEGQQDNPDFYGMVAAAVLDPRGRLAAGVNYLYGDERIHAERAAIDKYEEEYGELPKGSIVITTLSPCCEDTHDNRYGASCTDLLNEKHIKLAYCGYSDPSQDNTHEKFTIIITGNSKIQHLCREFANTFLKKDINESIPSGARAPLYHSSPITRAVQIIDSGSIKPVTPFDDPDPTNPNSGKPSVSLTRDPRLDYYSGKGPRVTFVIDQDALRQITKIHPITYPGVKRVESEERVYKPIPLSTVKAIVVPGQLIAHIKEIKQIMTDRGDWINDEEWNGDSYDKVEWMLDHIMRSAKKQGIKIQINPKEVTENFADGKGPGRPGDSQRHGISKGASMAELEKASHSKGRKGQLARWQINMRRGKKK